MNNPLAQLQAAAKGLFKAKQSAVRTNQLHPKRDWLIGIGVAMVIVVALAVWNAYTYLENRNGSNPDDVTVETITPVYNAQLVERAHIVVAERAAAFAALQTQPTAPAVETQDPTAPTTTASTTPETEDTVTPTDTEVADLNTDDEVEVTAPTEENTTDESETQETTTQEEENETITEESTADVELDAAPKLSV